MSVSDRTVRPIQSGDVADIRAFTGDTWSDRDVGDYLPEVIHRWADSTYPDRRTLVAEVDGRAVGVGQARLLTDGAGWLQGMRVHPDSRREGHGRAIANGLCEWCRGRGRVVVRAMAYGWNAGGLGQLRSLGFEPMAGCRWARPEPRDVASPGVTADERRAWERWTRSDARTALAGLAPLGDHHWALAELSRDRFDRLATEGRAFAVQARGSTTGAVTDGRTTAGAVRLGTRQQGGDGPEITGYAVAAWDSPDAATRLFDAVAADAFGLGVGAARICIPETPRHVSAAASAGASMGDHAYYVLSAHLTGDS